jgi:hypothetical protein
MTDKELLELAAQAAGLKFAVNGDDLPGYVAASNGDWRFGWVYWNPLLDDGDALRLAVKLSIATTFSSYRMGHQSSMPGMVWAQPELANIDCANEWYLGDPCAATRRAIVRAAAEIGRDAA